jgi:hypothetical protein
MAAAAPARKPAPARKAPARKAPAKKVAPTRKAPPRGHLIPVAVGRTAVAVSRVPDTRPIVGLTRGRAWIAVLGLLLIGIVGLNVATLGVTERATRIDQQIQTLERENSILRTRVERRLSSQRVEQAAALLGMSAPSADDIRRGEAGPEAVREAVRRLAAASG